MNPRTVPSRQQTSAEPASNKPSWGRRAAAVAGGAAVVGGLYGYMHHHRPKTAPIPAGMTPKAKAKVDAPKVDAPKVDAPKVDAPKVATPAPDAEVNAPATQKKVPSQKAPKAAAAPKPSKKGGKAPSPGPRAILYDPVKWDGQIASIPKVRDAEGRLVLDPSHPGTKELKRRNAGWKRVPRNTETSARLRGLVQFNERDSSGRFGTSDSIGMAWRKGQRAATWVGRGGDAAGDIADIASGKKVENPFYKKSWFKRAMQGAAIAAPILASRKLSKWNRQVAEHAKGTPGVPALTGWRADVLDTSRKHLTKSTVGRKIWDQAIERPFFSAKLTKPVLLQAVARHVVSLDTGGWDVRDPRGRSARVYAPGARRRDRREKTWDEKADNLRLMRNVAALTAAAGIGGTLYYRSRALKGPRAPKMTPAQAAAAANSANVVPFRPTVSAAARVALTNFTDRRASIDKVLAATQEHAIDPVTQQMVPEVPPSLKAVARRVGDDAARGVVENAAYGTFRAIKKGAVAGSLLGAGALLGRVKKHPRLGLGLGAGAAGAYLAHSKKNS